METTTNQTREKFEHWAIVELMGHVRLAGKVTEEERFGCVMGRIDIPTDDGFTTQYFGAQSIYRVTFVTEETARKILEPSYPVEDFDDSDPFAAD